MKASDLFLQCLYALGIDIIFGVPGEENADLMMSLKNSPIRFIVCRHEQSAAFMADMHGRLTGKPGVCLATLGPGATNLITGVANANFDYSPLIAIVGQASTQRLHKESHQNVDAVSMYKPVTKWTTSVREADNIPEIILKAYKIATNPRPGAVMIELPEDIAKIDVNAEPLIYQEEVIDSSTSQTHIDHVINYIAESKKPLLLVGAGCVRGKADKELKIFIEKTGMYAADTFMGKGAVSANHPQSLHCVGLGMKDIALKAFDQADLVICAGYDLIEWDPSRWNPKGDKKIIHIDCLPAEVDQHYLPAIELTGDIKTIFATLNAQLTAKERKECKNFAAIREEIIADLSRYDGDNEIPLKPQRVLHELRQLLDENDILMSDVGAHKMWVARQYATYHSHTCFISNGFCSMGSAMPWACEAKRLFPQKNVVALCGDGGFIMSIQALATAVRYKIPITIVVWQDDAYGLIKWKQEMAYHDYSYIDLHNPDLAQVAISLGANGKQINTINELKEALLTAFTEKEKPTVLVVPIDYTENMKLTKHLGKLISS